MGWDQYVRLWNTPRWITSITNLAIYGILFFTFAFVIGFLLAVLMDQKIRAEGVFRTIYLYPFRAFLHRHRQGLGLDPEPGFRAGKDGARPRLGQLLVRLADQPRHGDLYGGDRGLWQGTGLVMA